MRPPFLALLVCFSASVTARAQDLGVVGLRTVTQPVYSAVSCAAGAPAAVLIDNRGQNVHTLLYQTSGPITALSLELRGRNNASQIIEIFLNKFQSGGSLHNFFIYGRTKHHANMFLTIAWQ